MRDIPARSDNQPYVKTKSRRFQRPVQLEATEIADCTLIRSSLMEDDLGPICPRRPFSGCGARVLGAGSQSRDPPLPRPMAASACAKMDANAVSRNRAYRRSPGRVARRGPLGNPKLAAEAAIISLDRSHFLLGQSGFFETSRSWCQPSVDKLIFR
jgi:hypothetical protein